jgi:hypothetical protein
MLFHAELIGTTRSVVVNERLRPSTDFDFFTLSCYFPFLFFPAKFEI